MSYVLCFGAGAFGTSMAQVLSHNYDKVYLLMRSKELYQHLKNNKNPEYLPGITLSDKLIPLQDINELFEHESKDSMPSLLVNALPTSAIRAFYIQHQEMCEKYFKANVMMISLSKGIDSESLELSDELFSRIFPSYEDQIYFLSGPSFAMEIVNEQATVVSLAGKKTKELMNLSQALSTPFFKAVPTYDIKGVLLGGALKNILAIAGGILEGLGYNHNTRAAMITRGINEMLRFGKVFNARPETFYSFSGMGDLILTTTSDLSRNKTFGLKIAKGLSPKEAINEMNQVVEGFKTSLAAHMIAKEYKIRTPLFHGIYRILYKNEEPRSVLNDLMTLPISEIE